MVEHRFIPEALHFPRHQSHVRRATNGDAFLERLRREVAELRIDNDILKKAAVILGTKNPNHPTK